MTSYVDNRRYRIVAPYAINILYRHISIFQRAIAQRNVGQILDMVHAPNDDLSTVAKFIETYQDTTFRALNARYRAGRKVEGKITIAGNQHEFGNIWRIWLSEDQQSPSGWKTDRVEFLGDRQY